MTNQDNHRAFHHTMDECPIAEVPNVPLWSENFALMGSDSRNRIMVYFNFGRWWQDPEIWREIFIVALPDNEILYAKNYGHSRMSNGVSPSLSWLEVSQSPGSFNLGFKGPVRQCSLKELVDKGSSDGPARLCTLDLYFHSDLPVWNMHSHQGSDGDNESIAGSLHIEQSGYAQGHLEYAGKHWALTDVFCNRDHSRGVREIGPYHRHNWIQGGFPDGTGFNLYAMETFGAEGLVLSKASITRNGKRYPATISHTQMIGGPGDIGSKHRIVLDTKFGIMEIHVVEVFTTIPMSVTNPYDVQAGLIHSVPAAMIFEEAVIIEWEGQHGTGICERGVASKPIAFNG